MTNPRQPDDVRLSTADLANAGDREPTMDRDVTEQRRPQQRSGLDDASISTRQTSQVDEAPGPLFSGDESDDFRHRWSDIQTGFVDEPRQAVERADELVASAIKRLAEIFADLPIAVLER